MPTMVALDDMFQRMEQAPALPMQPGGGMSMLAGSGFGQTITPEVQFLLHVSQDVGL